jgi:hypothetical protein
MGGGDKRELDEKYILMWLILKDMWKISKIYLIWID